MTDGQLLLTPGARVSERGEAGRGPGAGRSGNQANENGGRRSDR